MELLNRMFDVIVSENMLYDKNVSDMYGDIIEKYKKGNSIKDEDEIFLDIAKIVYHEQVNAFKAGVKIAFSLFNEISAI